ncbi:MAG: hypothetical protein ACTS5Y_05855 [Pollutimonas bauzanensis]
MRRWTMQPANAVLIAGGLAALAGAGYWGVKLGRPLPALSSVQAASQAPDPAAQALAAWFGPGDVRLDVVVSGLIKTAGRAAVVLAVNGAAPRAYVVGDELAQSARLRGIEREAIIVDSAGRTLRFPTPQRAQPEPAGIVRVPR